MSRYEDTPVSAFSSDDKVGPRRRVLVLSDDPQQQHQQGRGGGIDEMETGGEYNHANNIVECSTPDSKYNMNPIRESASHPPAISENQSRRGSSVILPDMNTMAKEQSKNRLSLKLTLVISLCFFTLAPALALWQVSYKTGTDAFDSMERLGNEAVQMVSSQLRHSMTVSSRSAFLSMIEPAERIMNFSVLQFLTKNPLGSSWRVSDFAKLYSYNEYGMMMVKSHPLLSAWNFNFLTLNSNKTYVPGTEVEWVVQWFTFIRFGINALTSELMDLIYFAEQIVNAAENDTSLTYFMLDQNNGSRSVLLPFPPFGGLALASHNFPPTTRTKWDDDIDFSPDSVYTTITLKTEIPTPDHQVYFTFWIQTSVYDVSKMLRSILNSPKERLFLCFSTSKGTLIGASHGRFFSHSDIDYSKTNPVIDPPPVTEFRRYTAINSSDPTISTFGQWLLDTYSAWDTIPEFSIVRPVLDRLYWASNSRITSQLGLKVQLYLLIDRESVLGSIERQHDKTVDDVRTTNMRLTIILAFVITLAVCGALLVSIMLTRALDQLSHGMDKLTLLQFSQSDLAEDSPKGSKGGPRSYSLSRFKEVSRCEASFVAMKRGFKAFVKYVPRDVVKLMVLGTLDSRNLMVRKEITVLFVDIVGFTTICENLSPEALMKVTTEYLETMCDVIVESKGTLDKFIGDCIMAMWNTPHHLPNHQSAACSAALEMQYKMSDLQMVWEQQDLPSLRFRIGINTGVMLVGNFGCDHRISYTCLGDGVNVASRLESINNPFGTVALVTELTQRSAQQDFLFRKIGMITVPGKSEVLTVYEPLMKLKPESVCHGSQGPRSPEWFGSSQLQSPHDSMIDIVRQASQYSTAPSTAPDEEKLTILFHWRYVTPNAIKALKINFEKGVEEFLMGNFNSAIRSFENARRFVREDGTSDYLIDLCRKMNPNPNGSGIGFANNANRPYWDGVIRFDKK